MWSNSLAVSEAIWDHGRKSGILQYHAKATGMVDVLQEWRSLETAQPPTISFGNWTNV